MLKSKELLTNKCDNAKYPFIYFSKYTRFFILKLSLFFWNFQKDFQKVEPLEPVQMNIYQSNTYKKDLGWLHFNDEPRVEERQQVKEQQSWQFQRNLIEWIKALSILKDQFSSKTDPSIFQINCTSVIRPIKRNQLSFSNFEIKKPLPASVHSVS